MNSRSLPLIAGLAVLLIAGLFVVFKGGGGSAGTSPARSGRPAAATSAAPVTLHEKQQEARTAIREGRLDDAEAALRTIGPDDEMYLMAQGDLGILYEQLGRPEDTLAAAHEVLSRRPEDSNALFLACRAMYMQGRYTDAEMTCLRAIEVVPENELARYTLALIRVADGRLERAIDAYLRAMNLNRTEERILDALADVARFQEANPDRTDVHYALAFFANTLGNAEQERNELELYLASDPTGDIADQAREQLAALDR